MLEVQAKTPTGEVKSPVEKTPDFCCDLAPGEDRLRVMWIWHAAVVAEYQKPLSVLAACPDLDVSLLVPRRWPERSGEMVEAENPALSNFRLIKAPIAFTGFYYIYFFPGLLYYLLRYRPQVIYCYEEAHTLIAAATLLLRRLFLPQSKVLLYAAQNIVKRYPLPFRLFEKYCFKRADLSWLAEPVSPKRCAPRAIAELCVSFLYLWTPGHSTPTPPCVLVAETPWALARAHC